MTLLAVYIVLQGELANAQYHGSRDIGVVDDMLQLNPVNTYIIPICSTHLECTRSSSGSVLKVTVAYDVVKGITTGPSTVTSPSIVLKRICLAEVVPRAKQFDGASSGWEFTVQVKGPEDQKELMGIHTAGR